MEFPPGREGDRPVLPDQIPDDEARTTKTVTRSAPGLWDYARPSTEQDWKASKVIRMKFDAVSAKVAADLPEEDAADLAAELWAGHVPVRMETDAPMPDFVTAFRL